MFVFCFCILVVYFQIHLHHQGEVPQMKDQGFAVAPGTHTLVGVKRIEVHFPFVEEFVE